MTTDERSTQFAGFAELLFAELERYQMALVLRLSHEPGIPIETTVKQAIARHAYDFAQHVVTFGVSDVESVPDMTTWPLRKNSK